MDNIHRSLAAAEEERNCHLVQILTRGAGGTVFKVAGGNFNVKKGRT